ncbi:MAG: acyl carrier protein [Methylobacteriaceae bacterium]|nr:acyl carrier protein [Methylobacteriaceae bacterium]
MGTEQVYDALTEIFHDVFMRDDIHLTPKLSAKDVLGWDSMKMIDIILATEEHFGVKFRSKDVDRLQCVGDLVELIEQARV